MQSIILVFFAVALMALKVHSLPIFDGMDDENQNDNSLQVNDVMNFGFDRKPWVEFDVSPPRVIKRESGSTVELTCEASGSPKPVITWYKDQVPITEDEIVENVISELSYTEMAIVGSKLIINSFQPSGKNIYTCFARSGPAMAKSSTIVHTVHRKSHAMLSPAEYSLLNQEVLEKPTKPRIVSYSKIVMEEMGKPIIIPCRVESYPKAEVAWIYNDSEPVFTDGSRHMITSNGDLVFRKLTWADMGQYTCVARNLMGEDTFKTFVYPFANEK